ncbi:MAG TPA: hypothetical protein VED59_03145, partial [Acidimicrobiales bacterium]|nr:hypothetical protein [Acidimicrobiales bacterium]
MVSTGPGTEVEVPGAASEVEVPGAGTDGEAPGLGTDGEKLPWWRQISFRARVSVLVAVAVGFAVVLAAAVAYVAVRHQLEGQVTSNLDNAAISAPDLVHMGFQGPTVSLTQLFDFQNQTGDSVQVITQSQVISVQPGQPSSKRFFPLTPGAAQALKGTVDSPPVETVDATNGAPFRVASVATSFPGVVVQVGYPLSNMHHTLAYLRLLLILVALGGVALAAGLGWAVGRTSIRPVEHLTLAAEH